MSGRAHLFAEDVDRLLQRGAAAAAAGGGTRARRHAQIGGCRGCLRALCRVEVVLEALHALLLCWRALTGLLLCWRALTGLVLCWRALTGLLLCWRALTGQLNASLGTSMHHWAAQLVTLERAFCDGSRTVVDASR